MTYKVGESITNIQIHIGELQKQCAVFDMELSSVVNLARQIQTDAATLIEECEGTNESNRGRSDVRSFYGGPDMRPTCGTCRYFNNLAGEWEGPFEGECRRRSPELVLDDEDRACAWPFVYRHHWCGEYVMELFQ
jgi:hypothetical protein